MNGLSFISIYIALSIIYFIDRGMTHKKNIKVKGLEILLIVIFCILFLIYPVFTLNFINNFYITELLLILIFIIVLLTIIKSYFQTIEKKNYLNSFTITTQFKPPSDLHPAVAGYLIDKKIGKREFYATLFHLIINGHVVIDERLINNKFKYYLLKNKGFDGLATCERIISDKLFEYNTDSVSFDNISHSISKLPLFVTAELKRLKYLKSPVNLPSEFIEWCDNNKIDIQNLINIKTNKNTTPRKEYKQNIKKLRASYKKYNMDDNNKRFNRPKSFNEFQIFTKDNYTKLGAQERAKWLGFKNYLQTAERFRMDVEQVETFSKYLPYAIALGVETKWAKRFEDMNVNRLEWFRSQDSGTIKRHENQKVYFNHLVKFLGQIYVK